MIAIIGIRSYFYNANDVHANISLFFVNYNCIIVDTVMNTLCLMVQFKFYGNKEYYKYCGCLHSYCKRNAQKMAVKSMKNDDISKLHSSSGTISIGSGSPTVGSSSTMQSFGGTPISEG